MFLSLFTHIVSLWFFFSGNLDLTNDKPISLHALNGCECPSKNKCPEQDKRSLFYDTEAKGCTVLKANLVKVCDSVTEELYRITCINGRIFHPKKQKKTEKPTCSKKDQETKLVYKYMNNGYMEAEGHLYNYLDSIQDRLKSELANQVNDGQCQVEFWMVLNYSPCYTQCSGANTDQKKAKNIPNIVGLVKNITNDENITVRIAFGRTYTTKDPEKEPQEKMIKAVKHLSSNYKLYLCYLSDEWWNALEIEDMSLKESLKANWISTYKETINELSDHNIDIKKKQNCTFPGEVWKNPNSQDLFIDANWPTD